MVAGRLRHSIEVDFGVMSTITSFRYVAAIETSLLRIFVGNIVADLLYDACCCLGPSISVDVTVLLQHGG